MTHPLKGACLDESCPKYGLCHCGCGEATNISPQSDTRRQYVNKKPRRYCSGHHPSSRANMAGDETSRSRGGLATRAQMIPMERVRPLVMWMVERYGPMRTRRLSGVPKSTLRMITGAHADVVTPLTALRVSRTILMLRQADIATMPDRQREVVSLLNEEHVPAQPVREALERYMTDEGISAQKMQDWYAERFGLETRTGARHYKLVRQDETIPLTVADRWCVLVGVPLDYVYAEEAS